MTKQDSEFITTRKAAAKLGVSLSTIQLWVETGQLPAWKTAGGHRRIPKAAVESMMGQQQSVAHSEPILELLKVLVIEEDALQLDLCKQKFADWNLPLQLLTAKDGFEGLIKIGRIDPDLVITDLRMPGMDGVRMIRHLREQRDKTNIDVIVITALDASEIEDARILLPGIPVFPKPVPFIALRSMIENKLYAVKQHMY